MTAAPSPLAALFDLSWARVFAVFLKELVQMRRDRPTFAIMIMMPVMQLVLFGYAINTDPRHMPAVVEMREDGPMTRAFLASLAQSTYVDIVAVTQRAEDGEAMVRSGQATFLISIPEGFERRLVRGERPQILIAADASDPVAAGGAIAASMNSGVANITDGRIMDAPRVVCLRVQRRATDRAAIPAARAQ